MDQKVQTIILVNTLYNIICSSIIPGSICNLLYIIYYSNQKSPESIESYSNMFISETVEFNVLIS